MAKKNLTDYEGACQDIKEAIKMDTEDPNDFQAELIKWEAAAKAKNKAADQKLKGFLLKAND